MCKLPEETERALLGKKKSSQSQRKTVKFASMTVLMPKIETTGSANVGIVTKNDKSILDSGASTSFFKHKIEAINGTYAKGAKGSVQLAAGDSTAQCLGNCTIQINDFLLPNNIHVNDLNSRLVSVGKVCDTHRIVVFTSKKAVILNVDNFSVESNKIEEIASRSPTTGLYEFDSSN